MKVFVSHDHEDTKACAPLLRTLDNWGVTYFFDYAEDIFGQQLSNRVQAELAQSQVLVRVCTRATPRSFWMSIESGAFMGLIAEEHKSGQSPRRIVSLILDPGYVREPFDVTTTVIDATDSAHPQWVNTLRSVLGLPPLHDLAEVARGIYSPPQPTRMSRRAAIGLGAAGVVALAAVGAGGVALYEHGKSSPTTTTGGGLAPPTNDPALSWAYFAGDPKNLSGTTISATPVLDSGMLYIATQSGSVRALRVEDHTIVWTYQTPYVPAAIYTTPTVAQDVVYYCVDSTALFAVSNGAKLWEFDADAVLASARPVLAGGLLYVNTIGSIIDPDFVGVFDLKGNRVMSLNPAEQTYGTSAPLIAGGVAYVGGQDGYLYALSTAKPGPELWRADTGATKAQQLKQPKQFYVEATPALAGGLLYAGSLDGSVYALDPGTGAKVWSFATGDQIFYSSPVIADGVLYIGSNDHNLYALDAHIGQLVWQYATGDKINGTPTLADGVVYVGSYDKYVHAVDATSGKLLRKYSVGGKVFAQPVVANSVLYVATGNGWVLAFKLS